MWEAFAADLLWNVAASLWRIIFRAGLMGCLCIWLHPNIAIWIWISELELSLEIKVSTSLAGKPRVCLCVCVSVNVYCGPWREVNKFLQLFSFCTRNHFPAQITCRLFPNWTFRLHSSIKLQLGFKWPLRTASVAPFFTSVVWLLWCWFRWLDFCVCASSAAADMSPLPLSQCGNQSEFPGEPQLQLLLPLLSRHHLGDLSSRSQVKGGGFTYSLEPKTLYV